MPSRAPQFSAVGSRIRRLRQAKGISRNELARKLKVDVSSLAGWEAGKRLPRDSHRAKLARALDCDLTMLLSSEADRFAPLRATLVDTVGELPDVLADCVRNMKGTLRAVRLSAPYPTPAYIQTEWRSLIAERLCAGEVEVQRIEIFYTLKRLQETLSNILRYDGRRYYVKAYCVGLKEIVPLFSTYAFDETDFIIGGYWSTVPPASYPGLRFSGAMIGQFFLNYWNEVWRRGLVLNIQGAHDLSVVKEVAVKLGLKPRSWKKFVEEARALEIGDGAPPLI